MKSAESVEQKTRVLFETHVRSKSATHLFFSGVQKTRAAENARAHFSD